MGKELELWHCRLSWRIGNHDNNGHPVQLCQLIIGTYNIQPMSQSFFDNVTHVSSYKFIRKGIRLYYSVSHCKCLKTYQRYFLDLRNVFLNQEKTVKFSQIKKIYPAKKRFLVFSVRTFVLISENALRI